MKGFGTAKVVNPDGSTEEFPLHDPLNRDSQEDSSEAAITEEVSQETLEQVEQILNGEDSSSKEEITEEDVDNVVDEASKEPVYCAVCGKEVDPDNAYATDDGEGVMCEECNHNKNMEDDTPGSSTGQTKLEALMEKMRAINAKKAGTPATGSSTKGKRGKAVDAQNYLAENNGYPEVGYFKEEKDLKKFYKQLDDAQLDEWLEVEGLSYKPSDNEPINRMRKCMAILYCHFPRETKTTTKSKSKYADYSTEDLLQMAIDNDIEVKEGKGDPRILRMYTIMALKAAGLLQ